MHWLDENMMHLIDMMDNDDDATVREIAADAEDGRMRK